MNAWRGVETATDDEMVRFGIGLLAVLTNRLSTVFFLSLHSVVWIKKNGFIDNKMTESLHTTHIHVGKIIHCTRDLYVVWLKWYIKTS